MMKMMRKTMTMMTTTLVRMKMMMTTAMVMMTTTMVKLKMVIVMSTCSSAGCIEVNEIKVYLSQGDFLTFSLLSPPKKSKSVMIMIIVIVVVIIIIIITCTSATITNFIIVTVVVVIIIIVVTIVIEKKSAMSFQEQSKKKNDTKHQLQPQVIYHMRLRQWTWSRDHGLVLQLRLQRRLELFTGLLQWCGLFFPHSVSSLSLLQLMSLQAQPPQRPHLVTATSC